MQPKTDSKFEIHGSMDVSAQFRTYHTFMIGLRYIILATVVSASLLTIVFCTAIGWGGGLFIAFIELVIGLYFAKERKDTAWQAEVAELFITTEAESGQQGTSRAPLGIGRGTFTKWAISVVLATIAIGAIAALFPHAR